ncbi:MAG TPA: hypothetical protein DD726_06235, partial [Phycisphaerales bacterium]|nr:hypothetical protein [Phycisphaerales bacterium]
MTYLAIPISAKDLNTCKEQIKTACAAGAEALELRTDYIEGLNTDKLAEVVSAGKQTKLPVVVTCRDPKEGGQNNLPPAIRI